LFFKFYHFNLIKYNQKYILQIISKKEMLSLKKMQI